MSDVITWDDSIIIPRLKQEICGQLGQNAWETLTSGIDIPDLDNEKNCGCKNMCVLIERLEEIADKETVKQILIRVRHGMTREQAGDDREKFIECGSDLDVYLERGETEKREMFIRHNAEGTTYWFDPITDKALDFILNTDAALSAVRKGSELHITMLPYDMKNYFEETDARMKKYHYCHCPFARTSILSDEGSVSKTICNCSLGLAKTVWENTLGMKLDGYVLHSVLGGDDFCTHVLYLPDELCINNRAENDE